MDYGQRALEWHKNMRGKIEISSKVPLESKDDLSTAYTPGVAEPCRKIAENSADVYTYTAKGNMVAVVSDGSAVLGLGNVGPQAAIPVMEGKAILFKAFAGVDAFPICLGTQDTEEIIRTVKLIAPVFGGINLEDISAPRCFEIERRLKEELDIPVFHDDQHGTAVAVLAGLINAFQVVGKDLQESKLVINGIGAAGAAIARILIAFGCKKIYLVDQKGIININRPETMLNWAHEELALLTNPEHLLGDLATALEGADAFIGVSKPGLVSQDMVRRMNKEAVIFAMANPTPEIFPGEAIAAGAAIVGTGRSDFPNQVNNALVFPGIFHGALDVRAREINEEMKLAAARALAGIIPESQLRHDNILPNPLDRRVVRVIADAVAEAARKTGVARV